MKRRIWIPLLALALSVAACGETTQPAAKPADATATNKAKDFAQINLVLAGMLGCKTPDRRESSNGFFLQPAHISDRRPRPDSWRNGAEPRARTRLSSGCG